MSQENSSTTQPKTNWIKQLYFYVVIGFSLLFLCIGLFGFSKAVLTKFVFPKASNNFGYYGPAPYNECSNYYSPYYGGKYNLQPPMPGSSANAMPTPTKAEIEECKKETQKQKDDSLETQFQTDMLNNVIITIISAVVGSLHFNLRKFFNSKDS
jgi:hypothetical protein